jgi:hypothetical protein
VFSIEDAPTTPKLVLLDPNRHVGVRLNVSHPVCSMAALSQQVKAPLVDDKPDFDLTRLAAFAAYSCEIEHTLMGSYVKRVRLHLLTPRFHRSGVAKASMTALLLSPTPQLRWPTA